jgi:PLD-like domain
VTGATWGVVFNRPDQNTWWSTAGAEEYVIRDALLARIDALESGDWACLATYSFSASTATAGAAGPILEAMARALDRGATMGFVADYYVNVQSNYWPGVSLSGLAGRAVNPLELSKSPYGGIQHNKVGVFWFNASQTAWVGAGSWNFTGGASSYQWNIWTEIQDNTLGGAYSNEMRELLSGRFHGDPAKSHAHDDTHFQMAGMNREGGVRFAPYPDGTYGGTNALTDIVAAIDAASEEIFFALNSLTRSDVVDALIRACDRGVVVLGAIPQSDRALPGDTSYDMARMMLQPTNYATANRVRLFEAYLDGDQTAFDDGSDDLIHTKYMGIDPRGTNPLVIQGSANWTWSALVSTSSNDENVQFLPHAGIAEAFRSQFAAMTDGMRPWCVVRSSGSAATLELDYWLSESNVYELVWTEDLRNPAGWTNPVQVLPAGSGIQSMSLPRDEIRQFFRIQSVP